MKRPFFLFAIFLAILILTFRFFVKENIFLAGHISHFTSGSPRHFAIKGEVINDPFYQYSYFRKAQTFIVSPTLVRISKKWFPAYGNIRVTSCSDKKVKYGDEILFQAALKGPSSREPEKFDYKGYLERRNIYALATVSDKDAVVVTGEGGGFWLKDFAYDLKHILKRNIENLFRPPERYFLSAVLLGERQDIPDEWRDIFIKTQTMHLLAISGLHVGIIAFITLFLVGLFGFPRNFRYSATILILVLYAVMVGGRPSVVRATIMGVVLLSSYLLKRNADIYNSLGLAAATILIYNPDQLFDYGFILSFISVLSIIYMVPLFNRKFGINRINRKTHWGGALYYFSSLCSASCAVWLGLLPLAVNFFNIISSVSVVVNIFAIPALFVIIALSIFSMIIRLAVPFLGMIFAEAAKFFIAILLVCLKSFSKLPFAYFEIDSQNIFALIFYYMLLICIVEYNKKH